MFKRFNLQEEICKDKFILMKNSREDFCEINKNYITNINYNWHDLNTIDIEIPLHISINGKKMINPLYDKFLGKGQYIKVNDEEKYVVVECERTEDYSGKKIKSIKAQSSEIKLNDFDFYIGTGGLARKLFKIPNDIDISDGILDLALVETGWKIKTVSDKARLEMNKMNEIYYKTIATNYEVNTIAKGSQIFAYTFTDLQNPTTGNNLQANINYRSIKSYIDSQLQKDETITHQLGDFHTGIKRIVATYDSNEDYRYGIKYEITLTDDIVLERWHEFTYLDAMNIDVEEILMSYTNGTEVEKSYMKVRNFEEGTYKVYDFLKNEVEPAFNVKIIYDTFNKEISCYTYEELGKDMPLFLSYENFIKTINKKHQYDEIVSKLYVESEHANISEENPTGLNYILDYTYFKENGLMSDELVQAYDRYLTSLTGKQEQIVAKRIDLNTLNKEKINLDTERMTLEEKIKGLQSIWNAYVKEKDVENSTRYATEIKGLQTKHAQNLTRAEQVRQEINTITDEIKNIVNTVTLETATDNQGKIFNDVLLDEIRDITITDTISDDYYTTSYSLYKYAVDVLAKRNKLQIEFTVDVEGLLQNMIIPSGQTFDKTLVLGDYINMDDTDIDNGKVRLISFDYSPKEFRVSNFGFSNNDEDFSDLSKLSDVGRTIRRSASFTTNYKSTWVAGKDVNNFVNGMLTDYLDTKAINIRSRSGRNKYDQSEAGTYIIDGLNEDRQIYLGSGMICFTNDSWLTAKTCLDENGLVADTIAGRLIAGHNLVIGNENNTMTIDENGIQIEGNLFKVKGTDGTSKDFNSYLEVLNNSITAGVQGAKDHTDAQVKILSDSISTKVSKGEDFKTEFTQTTNSFDFTIGNDGTNVKMDKNGVTIKNGGLTVLNQNGETIVDGSTKIFKIKTVFEKEYKMPQNAPEFRSEFVHNLGYVPAYMAFQVGTKSTMGESTNTLIPAYTISRAGNAIQLSSAIRCNANETSIIVQYYRADLTLPNTFKVKFFIFEERLL